jgi:hypothetical protein
MVERSLVWLTGFRVAEKGGDEKRATVTDNHLPNSRAAKLSQLLGINRTMDDEMVGY